MPDAHRDCRVKICSTFQKPGPFYSKPDLLCFRKSKSKDNAHDAQGAWTRPFRRSAKHIGVHSMGEHHSLCAQQWFADAHCVRRHAPEGLSSSRAIVTLTVTAKSCGNPHETCSPHISPTSRAPSQAIDAAEGPHGRGGVEGRPLDARGSSDESGVCLERGQDILVLLLRKRKFLLLARKVQRIYLLPEFGVRSVRSLLVG